MGYGNPQMTSFIIHSCLLAFLTSYTLAQEWGEPKWEPGIWSKCQKPGSCGMGGTRKREIYCVYKSRQGSQRVSDQMCSHLPQTWSRSEECFKECTQSKYEVRWIKQRWSECRQKTNTVKCSRKNGIQTRRVYCGYTENGNPTSPSVCSQFAIKPPSEQQCDYNCPQNCVVGEFSPWSTCDDCRYLNASRTRNIIVPNSNRGITCPDFTEMKPCNNCSDQFFLAFSPWTKCMSFTSPRNTHIPSHPLIGQQHRTFECIDIRGQIEDLTKCVGKFESVVKKQACIVNQDCILGDWTSFPPLNKSCVTETGHKRAGFMRRTRSVKQVPLGDGRSCGPLEEFLPITSSTNRNCPRIQWTVSGWSPCKPINGHQQDTTGIQHRNAICMEITHDGEQTPVEESMCSDPRPFTSQICASESNRHCTVSMWGPWSACEVTDCEQYARKRRANKKTGQRYRTRQMLTRPGGGNSCPHLSETQNCDPEPCYTWKKQSETVNCILLNRQWSCGIGQAQEKWDCYDKFYNLVENSRCQEFQDKPPEFVQCHIPCPSDCVLSEWSNWSECPGICQNNKIVGPLLQKRSRTILAKAASGGNCAAELDEIKNCPTVIECDTYMWKTEPWGKCQLDNPVRGCGRGVQSRIIGCYNTNKTQVNDRKCTLKVKPEDKQVCTKACAKDCILTNWSEWTPCSASCTLANSTSVPTRKRQRYIMQYPENGGTPCETRMKDEAKCLNLPVCNQFTWVVSNWSECILPQVACGRGLRARDVHCTSNNGSIQPVNTCLQSVGQMPNVAEPCYKSCEDECVFTDWTSWSNCLGGCDSKRFRYRESKTSSLGNGKIPAKCSDLTLYPKYEQDICRCSSLNGILNGEWSECILDPPPKTRSTLLQPISKDSFMKRDQSVRQSEQSDTCGYGKEIRIVTCQSSSTLEVNKKCDLAEYEAQVCNIPCPSDCKMSLWSQWSSCPTKCRAGVQKRSRHIEQLPTAGGRQCPSLDSESKETQTRLCHPECSQYTWKASDWSMCLPGMGTCGPGTQSRAVNCITINANGHTTSIAKAEYCAGLPRPISFRNCSMPCVGECVLTEWTEWTECRKCNNLDKQKRYRKIMRQASRTSPMCPYSEDERTCIRGVHCMDYYWNLTDWTSCLVNNGMEECGVGHKERYPICRNHQGQDVDDRICLKKLGPDPERLTMSCEIPCDKDCLVSDWSTWTSCSKTCGLGESVRERSVVEQKIGNGRSCPSMLTQRKPCFQKGCFRWSVSDWSPCMPQKNLCGSGIETRNVSCLGDDGLPANPILCEADLNILVLKTEQSCHVPCPGECIFTEWTSWNDCFITCEDFDSGTTFGKQSRSRAILSYNNHVREPCPEKLWETRSCPAEQCTKFIWNFTLWKNDHREVWCQKLDGTVVNDAGCDGTSRPSSKLICEPECLKSDGLICNDTNTCGCLPKYAPLMNSKGKLMSCFLPNNTMTPDSLRKEDTEDSEPTYWMYAVVAAGTLFIVFVALALYHMSEFFRNGPRPHGEQKEENDTLDIESPDTLTRVKITGNENCSVCSQIPAPVDTMVSTRNGRTETKIIDDVGPYVDSWNRKSFLNRVSATFSCLFPCMSKPSYALHEHDNLNDTREKLPLQHVTLLSHSNTYVPNNDFMETEFNDLSNLVHTPSYYLAVNNETKNNQVFNLPMEMSKTFNDDSVDTEESSSPDSTKSQNMVKRSQSDSAISIPATNSTGVCSFTNSPSFKSDKCKTRRKFHSKDSSKSAKHSSTQTSTQSSVEEMNDLVNQNQPKVLMYQESTDSQAFLSSNGFTVNGSMANFMEDYFEKINSLGRDEGSVEHFKEFQQEEQEGMMEPLDKSLISSSTSSSQSSQDALHKHPESVSDDDMEQQHLLADQNSEDSKTGFCIFVPSEMTEDENEVLDEPPNINNQSEQYGNSHFDSASFREKPKLMRQKQVDDDCKSEKSLASNSVHSINFKDNDNVANSSFENNLSLSEQFTPQTLDTNAIQTGASEKSPVSSHKITLV